MASYLPHVDSTLIPYCGRKETIEKNFDHSNAIPRSSELNSTLIVYHYYESEGAVENLRFFVQHGLHEQRNVDFLFIFSSEPCISIPDAPNIAITRSLRKCHGFSAIKEALIRLNLGESYKTYILTGSWVKGPFMPTWSTECWTNAFTRLLNNYRQLLGTSYSCRRTGTGFTQYAPHLHPTAWAVTKKALETVLEPFGCSKESEIGQEIPQTMNWRSMRNRGLGAAVLASSYVVDPLEACPDHEWQFNAHPYETIFVSPRLPKTLKAPKFVASRLDRVHFEYIEVCSSAMEEVGYDSRQYCNTI